MVAGTMERGADQIDPYVGVETWEHTSRATLYIARFTGKYGETEWKPVVGRKKFTITPAERRMNSDLCASPAVDPFRNGTCVPVSFTEETPAADIAELGRNTQVLPDPEIDGLLATDTGPFLDRITKIDNPSVLLRVYERAVSLDAPFSKVTAVRDRLRQIDSSLAVDETPRRQVPAVPGVGEDEPDAAEIAPSDRDPSQIDAREFLTSGLGAGAITVGEK
jgi:hypothetical protein